MLPQLQCNNENKVVIIIGMHRSGTSLVTNWLNKCGLNVGNNLLGSALGNVEGHFEDVEFYKLHMEILTSSGYPDSGMIADNVLHFKPGFINEMQSLISKKNSDNKIWGWKDPRTCLFLDIYRQLIPDALHFTIIRDYQSVVISLLNRGFIDEIEKINKPEKNIFTKAAWKLYKRKYLFNKYCKNRSAFFLKVWVTYNQNILDNLLKNSGQNLVIDYNFLKTSDAELITYLNKKWNLELDYIEFKKIYKEELMSNKFNVARYINDKQLIEQAIDLQDTLSAYIIIEDR